MTAIPKLNRTQRLMTAKEAKALPPLYSQDGKGDEAVVYLKLFNPCGSDTWYFTEYDPVDRIFFGLVVNSFTGSEGELGYTSADELCALQGKLRFGMSIERDIHWKPKTLGEIRGKVVA